MSENRLVIEKGFKVGVQKLFKAWTDPEQMGQWMGPGNVRCKDVSMDLKVGGVYRIHMISDEGDHVATGEYKAIRPLEMLSFTWGWENGEVQDTLVTIEFEGDENQSKMHMVHEQFATAEHASKHQMGWDGSFAKLESFLLG